MCIPISGTGKQGRQASLDSFQDQITLRSVDGPSASRAAAAEPHTLHQTVHSSLMILSTLIPRCAKLEPGRRVGQLVGTGVQYVGVMGNTLSPYSSAC